MGGESGPRISRRLPPPANHAGRVPDTSAQTRHSTVERHQLKLLRSQLGSDQSVAQQLRSRSSRAQLCGNLIEIAHNTADDVIRQEGRVVSVEVEIEDFQLPFILPEDGHSSEMSRQRLFGFLTYFAELWSF